MPPEMEIPVEIVPKEPRVLYLAHLDFVYPRLKWQVTDGKVIGSLDDLGPAAIAFSTADQLKGRLIFTNDEETTMRDAIKIAKRIEKEYRPPQIKSHEVWKGDRGWLPTVVVLEVTDINTDCDVSFENIVFFDANKIRKVMNQHGLKDIRYRITPAAGWDESFRMAENKMRAFSLCLPVHGSLHSLSAWVEKEKLDKYRQVLLAIDKEFS